MQEEQFGLFHLKQAVPSKTKITIYNILTCNEHTDWKYS